MSALFAFWKNYIGTKKGFRDILANTIWIISDKIIRLGLGLIVGIWVARYLGPSNFGLLNYALAYTAIFGVVATLGLDDIVIKELIKNPEARNEILGTAFIMKFIAGCIIFFLTVVSIIIFKSDDILTLQLITIIGLSFIFQSLDCIDFFFQSQVKSKYTVISRNASFILFSIIKVSFIYLNLSIIYFAILTTLEVASSGFFLIIVFKKLHNNVTDWKFNFKLCKGFLHQSWSLTLSGLLIMLYMRIDQVMLGELRNEKDVGIYSVAVKISELWYFIPMTIASSVFPSIINAKRVDERLYLERLQNLYDFLTWFAIGVSVIIAIFSDFIIELLYGYEYSEASDILPICICAGIFVAQGVARGKWILIENLQKYTFIYTGVTVVINIGLNLILIPKFGGVGAAYATLISYISSIFIIPFLLKATRPSSIQLLQSFNLIRIVKKALKMINP